MNQVLFRIIGVYLCKMLTQSGQSSVDSCQGVGQPNSCGLTYAFIVLVIYHALYFLLWTFIIIIFITVHLTHPRKFRRRLRLIFSHGRQTQAQAQPWKTGLANYTEYRLKSPILVAKITLVNYTGSRITRGYTVSSYNPSNNQSYCLTKKTKN